MIIDTGILIATGCGIVSTGLGSFFTWFFSKKKYNSEVEGSNIQNMKESLEFYVKLSDDTNKRLIKEIEEHNNEVKTLKQENADLKKELKDQENKFLSMIDDNRKEINLMKNQMLSVYGQVCLNFKCTERKLTKEMPAGKHDKKPNKNENI